MQKTIVKPSACSSMTREMLADIDIIIPNEDELFELCSKYYPSMEAQAASMLECGISAVIVTLREKGCYVKTKDWEQYFLLPIFLQLTKQVPAMPLSVHSLPICFMDMILKKGLFELQHMLLDSAFQEKGSFQH